MIHHPVVFIVLVFHLLNEEYASKLYMDHVIISKINKNQN